MADFRKISVLVALVVLLGLTSVASAQVNNSFTCSAAASVPPTVRAEGLTELVGDIVLDCTNGVPTATTALIPQVNFTIFLNTAVTSRIINTSTYQSEAIVIVDEPNSSLSNAPLALCTAANGCAIYGAAIGTAPYGGGTYQPPITSPPTLTRYNVFQGIIPGGSSNQVQFLGIPVDPPGTTGHRIFRFTNIRANASAVSSGAAGTPGTIQALISANPSQYAPITYPTQIVGYVQQGMVFTPRNRGDVTSASNTGTNISFPQCNSLSRTGSSSSFILEYKEGFATSFKTVGVAGGQSVPGQIYNTETGFTSTATGFGSIGVADHGTRLKAVFTNIPAGVNIYASTLLYGPSGAFGVLKSSEYGAVLNTPAGNTDFVTPGGLSGLTGYASTAGGAQLLVSNSTATAVWEVTGANTLSTDSYYAAIWFSYSANAAQNSPAPGTAAVAGSFAPTPTGLGTSATTAGAASATLPIPRFVDASSSRSIFTIYLCRTNLLFPYVTNAAGFDTGLAIANTSLDTGVFAVSTPNQAGGCTLFSYGDNAPASIPTGTIAAGKVYVNLASAVMPNFSGYVIAQCNFQYAHGFAFVSDFGARNLAMGYLALVIPEPGASTRGANPLSAAGTGTGEALGN